MILLLVLRLSDSPHSTHSTKGYYGCAVGKGKQAAKTEIEKLKFDELSIHDCVKHVARMYVFLWGLSLHSVLCQLTHLIVLCPSLHSVHDETKDRLFEIEMSWICAESNYQHAMVPQAILDEANRLAVAEAAGDEMEA